MLSVLPSARRFGANCLMLTAAALFAQALHAEPANHYTIAPQRLAMLDQAMQAQIDQGKLAGIDILIYQDGEVIHRKLTGYQELDSRKPLAEDTLYKIFSLTKPITGTALLMLYEQGKFQLDDPVELYLPQFKGMQVAKEDGPDGRPVTEPAQHPLTIRELMNHTAGFTYGRFSESQVDALYVKEDIQNPDTTLADMIEKLAVIPLRQQPGTQWHYSVSVDIQARLVEVLSGMSFDAFLEQNIFKPLGMKDTGFYVPADKAERLAVSYRPSEDGLQPLPNDFFLRKPNFLNGGGGLISSMDDYLRFARMLLNEGELDGVRLLQAETVRLMASDQLPKQVEGPNWAPGNRFGLNVAVVNDSSAAQYLPEGTYWWWGIQGPWMWVDPANGIITLGMMQNTDYRHSRVVHGTVSNILYRPAEQ
jgi:CubicO group peptidase (beta-lactamase class C family)